MRQAGWFAATALFGRAYTLFAVFLAVLVAGPVFAQSVFTQSGPGPALAPGSANVQASPVPAAPQPGGPPAAAPPTGLVLPPQPPPPPLLGGSPSPSGPAAPSGSLSPSGSATASGSLSPSGSPAASPEQRGFLNGFGTWWDKSIADWKAKMKQQQTKLDAMNKQSADAAKDAALATQQALKNAADAMRPSHVIEIQQTCPVAGNGAADCATAATNVCKAKGYSSGQPLDVRTAEKCSDSLWVSGKTPTAADCPVETTLLRVACQ